MDVVRGSNSTKVARELGRNCLVMKILSCQSISINALRKNLRMIWKPSKGIQISEIEDEMYMVEFEEERDKKKVLVIRPWCYDKQLILLQEFEGEKAPQEIALQWSPFWIPM